MLVMDKKEIGYFDEDDLEDTEDDLEPEEDDSDIPEEDDVKNFEELEELREV